jgi:DNA-binding HxlR family transcriptional regulator
MRGVCLTPVTKLRPSDAQRDSEPTSAAATLAALAPPPGAALRSICPVANALDLIGDRWTLLVIRDLLLGKSRFGDFLASPERIPTNILADRLKRLAGADLVEPVQYSTRPPRYAYQLTAEGQRLAPVIDALAVWGLQQFPGTRRARRPSAAAAASDEGSDEPSDRASDQDADPGSPSAGSG